MSQHLTDLACLEWVRSKKIVLAPETTSGVEIHLAACPACRAKVADFETLERSFHPFGAPMPVPRALRIGKALKIAAIVLAVGALVWAVA
jgi:anti-sigma factor RsiW